MNPSKQYDKVLNTRVPLKHRLSPKLRALLIMGLKPFGFLKRALKSLLEVIENTPKSIIVLAFFMFMFFSLMFFTDLKRKQTEQAIIGLCPSLASEIDAEGNVIKISPYDAFVTQFNSAYTSEHLMLFHILSGTSLLLILRSINPDKPQIFKRG